jgi:hypothetical protein
VLAKHLKHPRIPNQIRLKDRCGRKPFEELRLHRVAEIIAIAESSMNSRFCDAPNGAVGPAETFLHITSPAANPRVYSPVRCWRPCTSPFVLAML